MGLFFGTDGIRGQVNDDLSQATAYKCGNALGGKNRGAKVLIGRDTRLSGSFIGLSFATGAMNAGATVVDVGVCHNDCDRNGFHLPHLLSSLMKAN